MKMEKWIGKIFFRIKTDFRKGWWKTNYFKNRYKGDRFYGKIMGIYFDIRWN